MVSEIIELQTNDLEKVLRLSEVEKSQSDGKGYYSCKLEVISGGFSCEKNFYFDDVFLRPAVEQLEKMSSCMPESATIKEEWENDFIRLTSNKLGHVSVEGELSEGDQQLVFSFKTDQTVLKPFLKELREWLLA